MYHNWADLRELLLRGECDLVISAGNSASGCESALIGRHRIVLIVPKSHPLAQKESVSLSEIENEKLIAINANSTVLPLYLTWPCNRKLSQITTFVRD